MNPVEICTINQIIPIFKDGVEAERIAVARIKNLAGEELQFNIIIGKGLYNIGNEVCYIMPDYSIPDSAIFSEYWRPGGDPNKSMLGKNGRIRAKKFNFQFKESSDPIYSNGILLPISELLKYEYNPESQELMADMGITKYVAEDSFENQKHGLTAGALPSFLYATDETRIQMLKSHVDMLFENKEILSITRKRDGCLDGGTMIDTIDGQKTIRDIFDTKYSGGILCYNHGTNQLEFKNITDYMATADKKEWFEVELEDGHLIRLTGNHRVWLPELQCYRRADELVNGDSVLLKNEIKV